MVVWMRLLAILVAAVAFAFPFLEELLVSLIELRSYDEFWCVAYPLVYTRSKLYRDDKLGVPLVDLTT